jgi:hypothetical protein
MEDVEAAKARIHELESQGSGRGADDEEVLAIKEHVKQLEDEKTELRSRVRESLKIPVIFFHDFNLFCSSKTLPRKPRPQIRTLRLNYSQFSRSKPNK